MNNISHKIVKIVTDSVAQIPIPAMQDLGICSIPFHVNVKGRTFRDGVDLRLEELYRDMRQEEIVPTTSYPSVGEYIQFFKDSLKEGAQSILYIGLAEKLSGAISAATKAAMFVKEEFPDRAIEIYNSCKVAAAQGYMVIRAAQESLKGTAIPGIISACEQVRQKVGLVVSLETLEYLARGGRIGKAAFMLGNLIKIRPILTLDEDGLVLPVGRARSEEGALRSIVDTVAERVQGYKTLRLTILEGDARAQAARLRELILEKLNPVEILHAGLTPVLGVHTGPGTIGVAYEYA